MTLTHQQFVEHGREGGIKSSKIRYRSLVTGLVGSAGSIALHHKRLKVSPLLKELITPSSGSVSTSPISTESKEG